MFCLLKCLDKPCTLEKLTFVIGILQVAIIRNLQSLTHLYGALNIICDQFLTLCGRYSELLGMINDIYEFSPHRSAEHYLLHLNCGCCFGCFPFPKIDYRSNLKVFVACL